MTYISSRAQLFLLGKLLAETEAVTFRFRAAFRSHARSMNSSDIIETSEGTLSSTLAFARDLQKKILAQLTKDRLFTEWLCPAFPYAESKPAIGAMLMGGCAHKKWDLPFRFFMRSMGVRYPEPRDPHPLRRRRQFFHKYSVTYYLLRYFNFYLMTTIRMWKKPPANYYGFMMAELDRQLRRDGTNHITLRGKTFYTEIPGQTIGYPAVRNIIARHVIRRLLKHLFLARLSIDFSDVTFRRVYQYVYGSDPYLDPTMPLDESRWRVEDKYWARAYGNQTSTQSSSLRQNKSSTLLESANGPVRAGAVDKT